MKTRLKKILSLVLCVSIVFGTVAASHTEQNFSASASDADLTIPTYEELVEQYGTETGTDGLTDGFIYVGAEYYEEDGKLTDYKVQPGDRLDVKVYIKSNMYLGDGYIVSIYDNSHWDVKVVADGATLDSNGYTAGSSAISVNTNHPAFLTNCYTGYITSANTSNAGWIKNLCGFDTDYLAATDLVQSRTYYNSSFSTAPYLMQEDTWVYSYYITVNSDVAYGTEIKVESPEVLWQSSINTSTGNHDLRKRGNIPCAHISTNIDVIGGCKTMASRLDAGALDYFINDLERTFTVVDENGNAPETTVTKESVTEPETTVTEPETTVTEVATTAAESDSSEDDSVETVSLGASPKTIRYDGTSTELEATGIISYADLEKAYGIATGADGLTDGFLYIATEYYEADGKPTDYYVQPGDKLDVKVYIKSNMKTGDGYVISFYNNSKWDVKLVADGATTDANGYTSNYSGGVVNPNHPAITTNGYSNVITSINITNAGWIKNTCGFDTAYLAATDLVQTNTSTNIDVGSEAYQMTSDEWVYSYYVTVKEDVQDGEIITAESPDVIWQSYINPYNGKHDARKRAYIGCGHITNDAVYDVTNVKTMANQMDSGALDYFINGLNHTFIIGNSIDYVVDGDWTYYVANDKAVIIDLNDSVTGHISIPSTLGGYPVVKIDDGALSGCTGITELTIPSDIEYIGNAAFSGCTSLTTVNYNATNCEYMGHNGNVGNIVFYGCDNLSVINIASDVVTIPGFAFAGCSGVESIDLPDSIVTIGNDAFAKTGIVNIELPANLTEISYGLFEGCSNLQSVTIPDGVISIGECAFALTGITNINLPANLTKISSDLFMGCVNLQSITIPENVTSIGAEAFANCLSLTEITIPVGVTSIGGVAFYGCTNLKKVIYPGSTAQWNAISVASSAIPETATVICLGDFTYEIVDGEVTITGYSSDLVFGTDFVIPSEIEGCPVTAIGDKAFYSAGFTNLYIPETVTSIGVNAFGYCSSLQTVDFSDGLVSLGTNAFSNCTALTAVNLPESLTTMGNSVFLHCTSLTDVTLPSKLTSVGGAVFNNCTSIKNIVIPDGYTSVPNGFLINCSGLESVSIPESVVSVGNSAFNGCTSLKTVNYKGSRTEWDTITLGTNNSALTSATINCLKDSFSYEIINGEAVITGFNPGANFDGILAIPSEFDGIPVVSISDYAFSYNAEITVVTIPEGVTSIGIAAFEGCELLSEITLPDTLTFIGESAFNYCYALNEIAIPEGITQIYPYTFYECTSLSAVTIPESVTVIDNYAFENTAPVVYYGGSEYQWNNVDIDSTGNSYLKTAEIYFGKFVTVWNVDGEETVIECKVGEAITVPESPVKDGYVFGGWTPEIPEVMPESDLSFIATWIANPHTITWIADGVENIVGTDFGEPVELPDTPIKKGHTFAGWTPAVPETMPDEDLVFTAEWTVNTYKITWNAYGDKTVVEYEFGESVSIPTDPTRYGYTFVGWDGEIPEVMPDENLSFKAEWKINIHKITWNIDGEKIYTQAAYNDILNPDLAPTPGGEATASDALTPSDVMTPSDAVNTSALIDDPEKFGYTFDKWVPEIPYRMPDEDLEFTATWTANPYNIYWNVDGEETVTVQRYNEAIVLPEEPVKEGMGFLGWSPEIPETTPAEDLTFYAVFAPVSGTCGADAEWSFDRATGKLTVTGTGDMWYWDDGFWTDTLKPYIKSVEISDGITSICSYAFEHCGNLSEVVIPNSVTEINGRAFYNCDSLLNIEIPSSVAYIYWEAFAESDSLTEITIPESVVSISSSAFLYCDSLMSFNVDEANENYSSDENGVLFNKDKTTLIQYPAGKPETEYSVPESVTVIGDNAFYVCYSLVNVDIPDSVTSIGSSAFYGCTSLAAVVIPDSVTSLGSSAFYGCDSLVSAVLPEGITVINDMLFYGCDNLKSIDIPDGVTSIQYSAFGKCISLENLYIPDSVTSIGNEAFENCDSLETVSIPGSVECIEEYAFAYCASLASAVLSEGVTEIGDYAFYECMSLADITLPDSIRRIGFSSFLRTAYQIKSSNWTAGFLYIGNHLVDSSGVISGKVTVRDGTLTIANGVLSGNAISEVILPEGLRTIGSYAFDGQSNLYHFEIPDSVTIIGDCAFHNTGYYCDESNWENGALYLDDLLIDGDLYDYVSEYYIESFEVKDGTRIIADGAFDGWYYLNEIRIPDSVTHIGRGSLRSCDSLTAIYLGDGIVSIDDSNFVYAHYYGDYIYYKGTKTEWNNISIGKNNDGLNAFNIYYGVVSVATEGDYTYGITPENTAVILDYSGSETEIVIPSSFGDYSVIGIGKKAFCYEWNSNYNIQKVTVPEGVTYIGDDAFGDCYNLKEIVLPETLTSIGERAFYNSSLESLIIPDAVTFIGAYAFAEIYHLTEVKLPSGLTEISDRLFESCDNLSRIDIPEGVTKIGTGAFQFTSLKYVIIPDGVTEIGDLAFGYSGIICAEIPDSVTKIGVTAFDESELEKVYFGGTEEEWNSIEILDPNDKLNSAEIIFESEIMKAGDFVFIPVSETEAKIIGYTGSESVLTVPSKLAGYTVTEIVSGLFSRNNNLTEITIPKTVKAIPEEAFRGCENLRKVNLSVGLETIGNGAFSECESLESIDIPEGVTSIGQSSFLLCVKLKTVSIPSTVTEIGEGAFGGCISLESVSIPEGITEIKDGTFMECFSLDSIEIPDSVTAIGDYAFAVCFNLQRLELSENIVSIGESAFAETSSGLTEVVVDPDNEYYMSDENGALYTKDKTVLIVYPLGKGETSITVPDGVTEIADYAFIGAKFVVENGEIVDMMSVSEVREIILPDSVISIGEMAFMGNSKLNHVHIPSSVTSIDDDATFWQTGDAFICSDSEDCYAKTYAEEEGMEFRVCEGHDYIVTLSETEMTLDNKETAIITAKVTPNYSSDSGVVWSSSDETVATVDESGYITTHRTGETVITATSVFGDAKAECVLTVLPAEFEIKWNVEGEITTEKIIEGTAITYVPPVKEGYSFVGWTPEVPDVMPAENLEFTAVFEINSYTVSWNVDGFCLNESYVYGEPIDSSKTFVKTGYTFAGWTPEIPETMPAEDIVFTAAWTANLYESVFNGNGGVWSDGAQLKKVQTYYNESIIMTEIPVKEGYEFAGWAVNGKNIGTNLGVMDSVEGKVFDAVWTTNKSAKYKIETYIMNTVGTYDKTTTTISAESYEYVSVTPTVETGFRLNNELSVLSGTVNPNGTLVLKVYIDRMSYNLTVITGSSTTTETYYYGSLLAEPETPKKSGFVFTNWSPEFPESMPANDLTVTAKFREKTQADNVSSSGISLYITPLNGMTLSYGESIKLLAYTTNLPSGYKVKWAAEGNCVNIEPSSVGKSCVVTSKSTGEAVITAWIVDQNGNKVEDKYGDPIQDTEYLYSEAGLWARILHFFRSIFKISSDAFPQVFKKIF